MKNTAISKRYLNIAGLAAGLLCLVLLTACGDKTARVPDTVATNMDGGYDDTFLLESYRKVLADDGIPLTDIEMRALISTGDFDQDLGQEELRLIQIYFKHYVHAGRPQIERFLQRSSPYIEYTRRVFRERGLPEELANLAYVESGYNPMAVSRSKATGMWQFMAGTGRQYGLVQDWWMDERRDPYRSTHAAADYLTKLYGDFNNWHLALAAYNAGEGKIGRAMANTGTSNFFALCDSNSQLDEKGQLKEETIQYVPRFIAICKIMRNLDTLGFVPAETSEGSPVIYPAVMLTARPGTDLAALAKHLGMSWDEFSTYNPAFARYITPPDRHVSVYVPYHAQTLTAQLLRDDNLVPTGISVHIIVKGDTLSEISVRTGVPVRILREMNPRCEPLQIGARLKIPGKAGTALASASTRQAKPTAAKPTAAEPRPAAETARGGAAAPGTHVVKSGETLASIGRSYNVSLAEMRTVNSALGNENRLQIGQTIKIPTKVDTYKVQPGDTMWNIAKKFNMPPKELLALNNMSPNKILRPGEAIRVIRN